MADIQRESLPPSVAPKPFTLEAMTGEQAGKLIQFKDLVKSSRGEHDLEFARWLIARQWDVPKAVAMYQNSMKWRQQVGADHILEQFPKSPYFQVLVNNYPTNHTDPNCPKVLQLRDGGHFCIENMGNLSSEAAAVLPIEEIVKYHIYSMELAEKVRKDIFIEGGSKELPQSFVVEDIGGIGMGHLSMVNVLKQFTKIDSDNYPETLRKVVIINVPTIFSFVWSAVQYFWDENQKAKFEFIEFGKDYKTVLLKAIPPSHLPRDYGGELDYSLPRKKTVEEFNKEINAVPKKAFVSDVIPRSGTLEKKVAVKPGTIVHYEFKTVDYDINFGIRFHHTITQVYREVERVESNVLPVFGRFEAELEGELIFHWDNTYSWTRGKDLLYHFDVVHKE